MPFFIPALFLGGAAVAALFSSGCNSKQRPRQPVKSKTKSPPTPAKSKNLKKDKFCRPDRYTFFLTHLEETLSQSRGRKLSAKDYFQTYGQDPFFKALLSNNKKLKGARKFIKHVADHDENSQSISPYDVFYATYHLNGVHCKRGWESRFLTEASYYSIPERIRFIGAPLIDASSSQTLQDKSRKLLTDLESYIKALPASHAHKELLPSLQFYLTQKDPPIFKQYLGTTYQDFLGLSRAKREEAFQKAVQSSFPSAKQVEGLFQYLTRDEAIRFTIVSFKQDVDGALPLFEQVKLPVFKSYYHGYESSSGESGFFPNLPQNTSFKKRQKAIDDFLGTPSITLQKKHVVKKKTVAATTINKYLWVGNTEVFSIESGKPGPTTLIFAPHYHEDNPRKMLHWIKDIPLETGRLLIIPEANRAYGLQGGRTVPMNRIFNEALTDDRIDYLIVRRVEYLMGMVDGMVGVHDALDGPYYISDLVSDSQGNIDPSGGPVASPWVPKSVKKIKKIKTEKVADPDEKYPAQLQWRIAEASRRKIKKLTSQALWFHADILSDHNSRTSDNASGYMHLGLKKPSMTFEGRVGEEHGQLHAMAVYTLLLAFGHKVHSDFENTIKNPAPIIEPKLYEGLPITTNP